MAKPNHHQAPLPAWKDRYWSILLLYSVFWTFAPVFFIPNYRPDVMEMILTGQNWVLATPKHGSLTCWLVEIIYQITGRAAYAPYLTSQICVFFSLVGIGLFAKQYLRRETAALAVFCMMSYYFFHFESTLYNNNTTLGLFWIWTAFFALRGVETGKKRWWILTGAVLGLGFYCKITMIFLAFAILFYLFARSAGRRQWRSPGPWLTTLLTIIIGLPLLWWNIKHDFAQFSYAFSSASDHRIPSLFGHIAAPFRFMGGQLLYLLPIMVPLFPLILQKKGRTEKEKDIAAEKQEKYVFLDFLFWVPLGLILLFAILSGSPPRGALGCHLWYFFPVFCLVHFCPKYEAKRLRAARILSLSLPIAIMVIAVLGVYLSPAVKGRASRYHYPGKQIAGEVSRLWKERYAVPLPFVIGDVWITENVSVYGIDRARLWNPQWADEEEFLEKGGVLLWEEGNPESMKRKAEMMTRFPFPKSGDFISLTFPQQTPFKVPPAKVTAAFYPPKNVIETKSESK